MREIKLTRGLVALVDDEDYPQISQYSWYAAKVYGGFFYARRRILLPNGRQRLFQMHREILGITDRKVSIDHKDLNGLNNTRANLRLATGAQNQANIRVKKRLGRTSIFKGVHRFKATGRWQAQIRVGNKRYHLGYFATEEQAGIAYNAAALRLQGEFARINSIVEA